jgi:MarR family transcriptional regulator, transcriptional regulator for hemolysin
MNLERNRDPCGETWGTSGLGEKISLSLLLLGRLVGRRLERALAEEGLGLTPAQARVLLALHFQGPLTQAALALQTGVDPSTLVSTLDVMERDGMALREPSPGDRRAHLVTLTSRGERRVPQLFELWDGVEQELTQGMSSADRKSLIRMLKVLMGRLYAGDPPCG